LRFDETVLYVKVTETIIRQDSIYMQTDMTVLCFVS